MGQQSVARNALVVGLGNVGSRILGLVREQVIAVLFGASAATDAFRVAFRVPLTLYDLMAGGMISAALVPVFSRYRKKEDRSEGELGVVASTIINAQGLISVLIVVLLSLLAPLLMSFLARGYPPEVQALSVDLLRILLPALIFMCLSSVLTALLYAREQFNLPALAALAYNGGMLTGALLLSHVMGIASLAAGLGLGMAVQVLMQLPALRGLSYRFVLALGHPQVREVVRLYLPVALGLIVSTIGIGIDTYLASYTCTGCLAALGFATTLVQFPLGLVAAGVGAAVLPVLSRYDPGATPEPEPPTDITETSLASYKNALSLALRLTLVAIVPAAIGLAVLREPVIRLLFQHGAFDAAATQRTATAFLGYSPGLVAAALDQMLIYGFYARRQTLVPVLVGIAAMAVYLAAALSLLGTLGMPALAIANSVQWVSHAIIMGVLTYRAVGGMDGFGGTVWRTVVAGAALASTLVAVGGVLDLGGQTELISLAATLAVTIVLGAAVYLGCLAMIGRAELGLLVGALRRRR